MFETGIDLWMLHVTLMDKIAIAFPSDHFSIYSTMSEIFSATFRNVVLIWEDVSIVLRDVLVRCA